MVFCNSNMFVSELNGFSINLDIFETNILNLAVVITVLVYYGRSFLIDLLKNRKDAILKSLQDADNKLREAEEILALAKNNFEKSKLKANQIKLQGNILATQTSKSLLDAIEEDIKRLISSNRSLLKFEEEKSINTVCYKLGVIALSQATEILKKRVNQNLQKKMVSKNINKLSLKYLFNN